VSHYLARVAAQVNVNGKIGWQYTIRLVIFGRHSRINCKRGRKTMRLNHYEKGDVDVIEIKGKIMGGDDFAPLDEKLYALIGKGRLKTVIDLSGCDWINSTGLGRLIHHSSTFKNMNGELKLANLTEKIDKIITITRLTEVFDVADSLDEAIKNFKK
jgi:anti-sigma B factor antagonist